MIRMGVNPIGWSNDDMRELGGEIPLEQCLSEAKSAGFEGMELGHKFPDNADELNSILNTHGLVLVSGWYSANLLKQNTKAEMTALRPHLELLKDCGSKVLIFSETSNSVHGNKDIPLSKRPTLSDSELTEFGSKVSEIAELVASEGLRLVYHHHMGTVIQSQHDIHRLMDNTTDAVHLLLDTGHATWGGADAVELGKLYRNRISHIHTKDVRPEIIQLANSRDLSFLDAVIEGVFTVPGDGCLDFVKFLEQFQGYSGWVVVEAEQYQEHTSAAEYAKMGASNLRRFLTDAGLTIQQQ